MRREINIVVEKISNGYLFTETKNREHISKTFKDTKDDLFSFLKKNETIGGVIDNDDDMIILDIIRQDVKIGSVPVENKQLLEEVVVKEKFNPFPNKPLDEDELRLSVTKNNCYSAERLMNIDFFELDKQLPLSTIRKAEICGKPYVTLYGFFNRLKKGQTVYGSSETRVYMTVLAKYYEAVLGVRSSKKDELDKLRAGVEEQIKALDEIFRKNCLVHSNNVEPIAYALRQLLGQKE
jgi:hypothetical protein